MKSTETFELFSKSWFVDRTVQNYKNSDFSGTATGITTFSAQKDNIKMYKEEVVIHWNNNTIVDGTQTYLYQLSGDNITQFQYFGADVELVKMYDLKFSQGVEFVYSKGVFKCNNDVYNVLYLIESKDKFSIQYHAKGPQKNYNIYTEFTRCKEGDMDLGVNGS